MTRLAVIRLSVENGVQLATCAAAADVPLRTTQRWLAKYRQDGLVGLALRKPRPSVAAIRRRTLEVARERGWPVPSVGTVHAIVGALDPAMVTLAQDGMAAYRDREPR